MEEEEGVVTRTEIWRFGQNLFITEQRENATLEETISSGNRDRNSHRIGWHSLCTPGTTDMLHKPVMRQGLPQDLLLLQGEQQAFFSHPSIAFSPHLDISPCAAAQKSCSPSRVEKTLEKNQHFPPRQGGTGIVLVDAGVVTHAKAKTSQCSVVGCGGVWEKRWDWFWESQQHPPATRCQTTTAAPSRCWGGEKAFEWRVNYRDCIPFPTIKGTHL